MSAVVRSWREELQLERMAPWCGRRDDGVRVTGKGERDCLIWRLTTFAGKIGCQSGASLV